MDIQAFYRGDCFDAHTYFGAHPGDGGVVFRTYAPAALGISIIGEWNGWMGQPMRRKGPGGVFTVTCPEARPGMLYKYRIHTAGGRVVDHCDPYGFGMELRPAHASRVVDLSAYRFTDGDWLAARNRNFDRPLHIYEVHLGSWRRGPDGGWRRYHEIADELIAYAHSCRFTHLEFLPFSEHPADESWGYQNTGFFSPTARYGSTRDLKELVDRCHRAGLGVILDFVPVHFALDDYGLARYDGTCLYEYPGGDMGYSEWGTCNFLHSRGEVASFLQSAASYWLGEYHFDGIRMDAVSRAIYWKGEPARGVNAKAVDFIRRMNTGLHRLHPTAMLMAEDSTAFHKVTAPVEYDGLGFDYKWDMGWMNDTLNYFRTPPEERPDHYEKLKFSMHYFYNERYLLPLSHDEVVHGKATILQKMWGDYDDKFPQARALYLYMFARPGKKLNFMGNELAHFREWDESRPLDWELLEYPLHAGFHRLFRDLGAIYQAHPALHREEFHPARFQWLVADAPRDSVYIFRRETEGEAVVAAFNFSDRPKVGFRFAVGRPGRLAELLNTDWDIYGGAAPDSKETLIPFRENGQNWAALDLAPFSGRLFREMGL